MSDSCDPTTVSCKAPLSMEFSRQEYCSELPFPSPGDLPDLGIEPKSPALQEDSLPTELQGKPNILDPFCHSVTKSCLTLLLFSRQVMSDSL